MSVTLYYELLVQHSRIPSLNVVMVIVFGVAPQSDPAHKKKRVSWAGDDSLTKIHYFELDESERGIVWKHVYVCIHTYILLTMEGGRGGECKMGMCRDASYQLKL